MRDKFRGYYPVSTTEVKRIWHDGLVVADSNVLLQLYRLAGDPLEAMLGALRQHQANLWMPYQVGVEFHRNRERARMEGASAHKAAVDTISKAISDIRKSMEALRALDGDVDGNELLEISNSQLKQLKEHIRLAQRNRNFSRKGGSDKILNAVTDLYSYEQIGPSFTEEELSHARRIGRERTLARQPPGYIDAESKAGDAALGDYFLWFQTITKARIDQRSVIFITQEQKEDWRGSDGNPRPELLDEFFRETGQLIIFYSSSEFFKESQKLKPQEKFVAAHKQIAEELKEAGKSLVTDYEPGPIAAAYAALGEKHLGSIAEASLRLAHGGNVPIPIDALTKLVGTQAALSLASKPYQETFAELNRSAGFGQRQQIPDLLPPLATEFTPHDDPA